MTFGKLDLIVGGALLAVVILCWLVLAWGG